MALSDRFKELSKLEGSQTNFAKKTGLSTALISRTIKAGDMASVRTDTIEAILNAYPRLNARWLITGIGSMWLDDLESKNGLENKLDLEHLKKRLKEKDELLKEKDELLQQMTRMFERQIKMMEAEIIQRDPDLARRWGLIEEEP